MILMNDCRQGNRIPKDGSLTKNFKVEVGVEIGLIVNVESEITDGVVNQQSLELELYDKLKDIFHIDGTDKVLNDICIYNIQ